MEKPFKAYEGDQPYLFVSYAHEDDEAVYPEMTWLDEAGFNLWYDDGIHVGTVWRQALADALVGASGLVFFSTASSVESSNCLKEINFALDDDKPVFVVQLDDTPLPSLLRLSLSDRQALLRSAYDQAAYRSRLTLALATVVPQRHLLSESSSASARKIETDVTGIAIVPFQALGKDDDLAHFADCVTSSLVSRFHPRIFRTIVVAEEDRELPPRELGSRYDSHYTLSGILRGGKDRARGTFKLTSTATGEVAWSRDIDVDFVDLLQAEDDFVWHIDFAMGQALRGVEAERNAHLGDEDLDAYGLCLRVLIPKPFPPESGDRLRLALQRDPELLYAHSLYASYLGRRLYTLASEDPQSDAAMAEQHADTAIAGAGMNSSTAGLADVLYLAGDAHGIVGNVERNAFIARRAHGLLKNPQEYYYNAALLRTGQFEEVVEIARQGKPMMMHAIVLSLLAVGEVEESLSCAARMTAGYPDAPSSWARRAALHARLGDATSATECLTMQRQYDPHFTLERYERSERQLWHNEFMVEQLMQGFRELGLVDNDAQT